MCAFICGAMDCCGGGFGRLNDVDDGCTMAFLVHGQIGLGWLYFGQDLRPIGWKSFCDSIFEI